MINKFQSRIFSLGFLEGEELEAFKRDIISLNTINPDYWNKIVDEIKKIILSKTEREEIKIYEGIINSKLIENHQKVISAHRIIFYFLKKLVDDRTKEDRFEDIFNDICTLLNEKELDSIKKLLEIVKRESIWYESYKLKNSYNKGLFPYLKGVGTTVELRGVFNKELGYGKSFDEYKKEVQINKVESFVPAITVALTLDIGTPDRFCFQVSPELAEWLIEELKAALHKIKLLEENCKR